MRRLAVVLLLITGLFSLSPAQAENCAVQNRNITALKLTAQAAATVTSADQDNCMGRGVVVVVDLTVMTAATVTVTVQGKDLASGKYYTLLAGAAATSTGTTVLVIYPGSTAATNTDANLPLPRTWRASVVVANNSGTAAVTGTIGVSVLN
jgi:hypothetical protein